MQRHYAAWVVKHRPRSLKDVVGNSDAIQKFVSWLRSWEKGIPKKKAAFLHGPPGVGKTVTVESLAHDFGLELVEKNASDYRTEDAVRRFAGLASQYSSLFGRTRIVLLDELDGLTGTADRGGVKATTDIVKTAQCPVVLISSNAYNPRFSTLRRYCLLIEFKKPAVSQVMKHLKHVCQEEGIHVDDDALKFIAQRSEGDVRSAVMDLQALAQGREGLSYDDVDWLAYRDRQESIFTVVRMIIYGKTCVGAKRAVDMAEVDRDMLFEWIYENAPSHFEDPHDLVRAMDALSLADVYRGRIRSSQNWGFLRYVIDYMTAGVAMARQSAQPAGWIPFRFPERIRLLSRSRAERGMRLKLGRKIRRKCHISARRAASDVLPYLRIIFLSNVQMAAGLAKWLALDSEMVEYLVGNEKNAQPIISMLSQK